MAVEHLDHHRTVVGQPPVELRSVGEEPLVGLVELVAAGGEIHPLVVPGIACPAGPTGIMSCMADARTEPPVFKIDPSELVDLGRYPLLEPEGEVMGGVLAGAREQLSRIGAAELPGFVREGAMELLLADAAALAPLAWRSDGPGTVYLAPTEEEFPDGHPRRWVQQYSLAAVAYDLFPADSPLRALYEWDPVMRFVEMIVGRGQLYRYADACGALNLSVMSAGDSLRWHFDMADFVVSLALRDAVSGGDFDVAPLIRSAEDERYDAVARVLAGDRSEVVTLEMTPGTLLVFEGRHSLHQVSRVEGPVDRWVGLLAYDTKPGTQGSDRLRRVRYGRE